MQCIKTFGRDRSIHLASHCLLLAMAYFDNIIIQENIIASYTFKLALLIQPVARFSLISLYLLIPFFPN